MPTANSAVISWTTDQAASSWVEYGTTQAYGTHSPYDPIRGTNHNVTLTGLTANTFYYYRVLSRNAAGVGTVAASTFSTLATTTTSFTVTWDTNQAGSSQVEYGLQGPGYGATHYGTGTYGNGNVYTSVTPLDPLRVTHHSVVITGLAPATTYYYRAISRNAAGVANGVPAIGSFITPGIPAGGVATGSFIVGPIQVVATGSVNIGAGATGAFTIGPVGFTGSGSAVVIIPPPPPAGELVPPIPIVEIAFQSNPTDTPVWVNVTQWVQGLTINRGRQRELNQIDAGTLEVTLDNIQRRFDPTYTHSPYYGYILPMRRIRVRASYNSSVYPLFTGYIESWGQTWDTFGDATCTVSAVDAFKPLNLVQVNASFPSQTSDARINAVLDNIRWTIGTPQWTLGSPTLSILGQSTILGPVGDRAISNGTVVLSAATLANVSALQHLQDVTTSELGLLFVNKDGLVTFYPRNRAADITTSRGTFGELEMPYVDVTMAYDDTDIWNDVRVTASGGAVQVSGDLPSQQAYFTRTLQLDTLLNSDSQALTLASTLLTKYRQPLLQITSMTLDGGYQPSLVYPQILLRDLGENILVRRRPPFDTSVIIEQFSTIQGMTVSYDASQGAEWQAVWRLSPLPA